MAAVLGDGGAEQDWPQGWAAHLQGLGELVSQPQSSEAWTWALVLKGSPWTFGEQSSGDV